MATDTSHDSWQNHRFWSRLSWVLFLGWPANILVFPILYAINAPEILGYIWALAWMGALVIVGNLAIGFRCPRCGEPFFRWSWGYNGFARKCVHCGLPKWAEPEQRMDKQCSGNMR